MTRKKIEQIAQGLACSILLISTNATVSFAQLQPQDPFPGATPSAGVGQSYTIGSGDRLKLDLFEVPEYSGEYQVLSDGTLSLPQIGIVPVQGLTISQAAQEISNRFARFVRRPFVTLSLLETGSISIAIAGQVNRPGSYVLSPEQITGGVTTVTQVIRLAGGITESADIRDVQVRRMVPRAPGNSEEMKVDLWQLLQTGDISQDLTLQDGDTIFIPTATALSSSEATELASASFSPDSMTVNVVGEVQQPGAITVPPNTPLNQAILAAGGFNNRARQSSVQLIRLNPDGTASRQTIAVNLAQGANPEVNPVLRRNDTVVVSRSRLTSVTDTLGTVLSPLTGILRIFGF